MNDDYKPIEGIDYTTDENDQVTFTSKFLLKRGHCCQSGCKNCPYDYHSKIDPEVPAELQDPWNTNTSSSSNKSGYTEDPEES